MVGMPEGAGPRMRFQAGGRRVREGGEEGFVRQGLPHQAHGESAVGALGRIGPPVRAAGIEGELRPPRRGAEEVPGHRGDVIGPGSVRARRPAHHGPKDVIEDADGADSDVHL